MKTAVIKRSIAIYGHKTSVSMEDEFWGGLQEIADYKSVALPALVERIDRDRSTVNLSSAIRIFVFNYFRVRVDKGKRKQNTYRRN
jgi:predicted DNA-binding ribbon-helix-helix protein